MIWRISWLVFVIVVALGLALVNSLDAIGAQSAMQMSQLYDRATATFAGLGMITLAMIYISTGRRG